MRTDHGTSRRGFLRSAGLTGAGVVAAACAPAAAPGAAPGGAGSGGAKEAWEREWEELIAAARKEGTVVIHTAAGTGYREYIDDFGKAFGIEAEQQQFPDSATYVPKITNERKAGLYTLDVAVLPPTSLLTELKPIGAFDKLQPLLFRPDVLDDKVWNGGFKTQWRDLEDSIAFAVNGSVNHALWVNTDLVKEPITKVDDILDPKWKGKIQMADPRQGAMRLPMTTLRLNNREDAVRKLLTQQEPNIERDRRRAAENIVRGQVPLALGLLRAVVDEFRNQGVGRAVKQVDLPELDYQSSDVVVVYNKAPHPAAAKLFVNWLLTKEGATSYSSHTKFNSTRLDVPIVDDESAPRQGVVYKNRNQEEIYPEVKKTDDLIKTLIPA